MLRLLGRTQCRPFSILHPTNTYHAISDATLHKLYDAYDMHAHNIEDCELTMGVLTVKVKAGRGTYVINKQPANQQIWLSSPMS